MSMPAEQVVTWLRQQVPSAALTADSRQVGPGDVFFAFPGEVADGRAYIGDAIARGAAVVLYEAQDFRWNTIQATPSMALHGLKQQAGEIANLWYERADAAMYNVAVTGTNGKTSCTQWLAAALSQLDGPSAVIGTLGTGMVRDGKAEELTETGYTTPDAVLLQRRVRALREAGACALAIEASSIGLDQGRLNGLHIDAALFTNLTRDHLDYHGDMTTYEAAKARLFGWPGLRSAVLNLDDAAGLRLLATLQQQAPDLALTGYSLNVPAQTQAGVTTLHAAELRSSPSGTTFNLHFGGSITAVKTRLVGDFNVSNILGIIGVLLAKGHALDAVIAVVETLTAVPGRMQQFGGQDAPLVVIDYAHTPDALQKTLAALAPVAAQRSGQLWCVFGCGGDRDPGKRSQMGAVAMLAQHIIVTSDNPRNELPSAIIDQVMAGVDRSDSTRVAPLVIEDRAAAILWAVRHADKRDVILLAGKGHENYQEIRGKKLPFLDADHTALALATRATTKGHGA